MVSFYSGRLLSGLLCHWLVGRVGRRGFLKVDPLAGAHFLYSMSLQLARLVERIIRNLGEKETHRRRFPRRGQSLRYRLDRWPHLLSNAPQLPVLHNPYNLILPQGSDVRRLLPNGHVISSRHVNWGSSG